MERQFQINWPIIVEEARQRRKGQRLTQAKLAVLADVSTPTVSRFENGEDDIQLSSIMKILGVLGMVDQRNLRFLNPKVRLDFDNDVLEFLGEDNQKKVRCAIGAEALKDHFGGTDIRQIYTENREKIEQTARRKYLGKILEPDGSVLIRSTDF